MVTVDNCNYQVSSAISVPAPDEDFLLPVSLLAKQSHDDDISCSHLERKTYNMCTDYVKRTAYLLTIGDRARMPKRSEIGTSLASWAWQQDITLTRSCQTKMFYIIWF